MEHHCIAIIFNLCMEQSVPGQHESFPLGKIKIKKRTLLKCCITTLKAQALEPNWQCDAHPEVFGLTYNTLTAPQSVTPRKETC